MQLSAFRKIVWAHYRRHRRDFAWRNTQDSYHILVSEVMLQQTQAQRVEGFYRKFLAEFPTVSALANAPVRNVLRLWQGLGYNRRAVMLKRAAEIIAERLGGRIPAFQDDLEMLPGVGSATAGAILAYAFQIPVPFIETNIRRVFIYSFFKRRRRVPDQEIMKLVKKTLDEKNPKEWYYALMDYGAFLGKTVPNPNRRSRAYHRQAKFKGSNRELRGKALRMILKQKSYAVAELGRALRVRNEQLNRVITELQKEGFIRRNGTRLSIAA